MNEAVTDKTGEPVTVELDDTRGAYVIRTDSGDDAGRAFFLTGPEEERIFFHTEVDEEFSGRGLAKILVTQALAGSREHGVTEVPVCPLFVKRLAEAGEDYRAEGGIFRKATGADLDLVKREA